MNCAQQRRMRRLSYLLVCLIPWAAPLPGATLERLSLDDAAQKSTDIVRAKVLDSYAEFRGSVIYTHWKLQVVERWKGADQASVEILVPGGVARGFRQDIAGAPQLVKGKEYLLFLWTAKSGATYITGLSQGVFELPKNDAGDLLAVRGAISETMLDRKTWQPVQDDGVQMPYADMRSRVATALAQVGKQ